MKVAYAIAYHEIAEFSKFSCLRLIIAFSRINTWKKDSFRVSFFSHWIHLKRSQKLLGGESYQAGRLTNETKSINHISLSNSKLKYLLHSSNIYLRISRSTRRVQNLRVLYIKISENSSNETRKPDNLIQPQKWESQNEEHILLNRNKPIN